MPQTGADKRTSALNTLQQFRALRAAIDDAELLVVAHARAAGATWREIGDALGVSHVAAHKRHATPRS